MRTPPVRWNLQRYERRVTVKEIHGIQRANNRRHSSAVDRDLIARSAAPMPIGARVGRPDADWGACRPPGCRLGRVSAAPIHRSNPEPTIDDQAPRMASPRALVAAHRLSPVSSDLSDPAVPPEVSPHA